MRVVDISSEVIENVLRKIIVKISITINKKIKDYRFVEHELIYEEN